MYMRSVPISGSVFLLICSIGIGLLYASNGWEEYDSQWVRRNPQSRLEILERSLKHFQNARRYFKMGNLNEAERYARDALKVVPEFKEAYYMLAKIYDAKGKERDAAKYRRKGDSYANRRSILEEHAYLIQSLERLKQNYKPSHALNRIMLILLLLGGYCIIIFLISTTGMFTSMAMHARRMTRFVREKKVKEPGAPNLFLEGFPGEETETDVRWYWRVIMYGAPFLVCFGFSILFGAYSAKDIFIFTFFPGLLIAVIIHKLFFSDDDFIPPQRFGQQ